MGLGLNNVFGFIADTTTSVTDRIDISGGIDAAKSSLGSAASATSDAAYSAANTASNLASNAADATVDAYGNASDYVSDNWKSRWFDFSTPDGVQSKIAEQNALDGKNEQTLFSYATFDPNASLKGGQVNSKLLKTFSNKKFLYTQDADSVSYTNEKEEELTLGKRPYSVFNKYSLVNFRGTPLNPEGGAGSGKSKHYHATNLNTLTNPSASKIIEVTSSYPENIGYRYNYADFALAKYYGKLANNMMITLRRFAYPAPDDIISPKAPDSKGKPTSVAQPDIARAITWMGGPTGNELSDILKFSHGFNWKNAESQFQTLNSRQGDRAGRLGKIINGNTFLSAAASAGAGEDAYQAMIRRANAGFDAFSETYPNHVFGPLNVIKDVMVREQGLTFDQEFTLNFKYSLKEIGGANSKILMLDQLANILSLTYNNAPFWGGDFRYIQDGSIAKPLGNIKHIRSGQFGLFLNSVMTDLGKAYPGGKRAVQGTGNVIDKLMAGDFSGAASSLSAGAAGLLEGGGKALERFLGGGLMKLLNTPQGGFAVNSLLTGDPTGQWHVTIGNPLNPIIVMGNLICTNTEVHFDGPIGPNDFPEIMSVTVTLKPGMPRDKAQIESMFNSGRGRFYLQPKDTADINNTFDVSAYGNKDRVIAGKGRYTNTFRKLGNG